MSDVPAKTTNLFQSCPDLSTKMFPWLKSRAGNLTRLLLQHRVSVTVLPCPTIHVMLQPKCLRLSIPCWVSVRSHTEMTFFSILTYIFFQFGTKMKWVHITRKKLVVQKYEGCPSKKNLIFLKFWRLVTGP